MPWRTPHRLVREDFKWLRGYDPADTREFLLAPSFVGNPYGFTGHRFSVTGLNETPIRAYSPTLGRWLQRDPLGYIDGPSLYAYAFGNPVMWLDKLGLLCNNSNDPEAPEPGAEPPSDWPLPEGHGPDWEWKPNKNPNPGPKEDPGHWVDPRGRRWRYHPEDKHHNPHWDVRPPRGQKGPKERVPIGNKPPIKVDKPPLWARIGQHLPVPSVPTADKIAIGAGVVGVGAAGAVIIIGSGGTAAPVLVPVLGF